MDRTDITIVGAGVVGLAVAAELSESCKDIFVLEKNSTFGQETSSRNSEVIHAGLYYPKGSLKAATCIEGRSLLYEFCARNNVAHKKIGKLIVAVDNDELKDLERLFRQGLENGITDLRMLDRNDLKRLEPNVEAIGAIYSPSTGIIDSHSLMKNLAERFRSRGGIISYNTTLTGIDRTNAGFEVSVEDNNYGAFKFSTRILINCAGLNSDRVAGLAGLKKDEYKLRYCKGDYFRVQQGKARLINRLVYPVPKKTGAGLGIHATLDLAGSLRLGPDDEYVETINYTVDSSKAKIFYDNSKMFLPFLNLEDLGPDMSGIRPKLQGRGQDFRDFIIQEESKNNLAGFINLIGIESPGLTASLSIARKVRNGVRTIF